MKVRKISGLVALAALSLAIVGDSASAQVFRGRPRNVQPTIQPVQPVQNVQPVPPAPQPVATAPAPVAVPPVQAGGEATIGQSAQFDANQTVRGSQLIGQAIVDPRSQRVGIIKDFLIDSQSSRIVFVLMAPEGDANSEWIIVPFETLQVNVSAQDQQPVFILNIQESQLRTAPHMRVNAWETIRDPRFVGQVQQFYRGKEWTSHRPIGKANVNINDSARPDPNREGRGETYRQPGRDDRQAPQAPRLQGEPQTTPDRNAPPTDVPKQPEKPNAEPEKPKPEKIQSADAPKQLEEPARSAERATGNASDNDKAARNDRPPQDSRKPNDNR